METEKKNRWILAALVIPVIQTASGTSWLWTAAALAVCRLLCWGVENYTGDAPGWLKHLQGLWSIGILAELISWAGHCWPGGENTVHIPVLLMLLALFMAGKGRERTRQGAGILWWLILALMLPTGIAGIREIRWETLRHPLAWGNPALPAILLLPGMTRGSGKHLWIPAMAASVIVQGVIWGIAGESPIYEMSRSLNLFGTVKRFESLTAIGMTLGYFLTMSYVLLGRGGKRPWIPAAAAIGVYLTGAELTGVMLTVGTMVTEVVLPMATALKNNGKRNRKRG